MAQWDDIKYFFDEGIAYMVELIKSKNDPLDNFPLADNTYNAGTDSPKFGWGIDGTRTGTISESMAALYTWLDGLGDPEVEADLYPIFAAMLYQTHASHTYQRLHQLARQLDVILGAKDYIEANDERLSEHVQDVLGYLLPQNVFMEKSTIDALPLNGAMGGLQVGGAYGDGIAIDETQYGNHNCVLMVTNVAGCRALTSFNVTLKKWGDPVTEYVEAVNNFPVSAQYSFMDIGVHGTDMYTDCTNIVVTGGGFAGDIFRVFPEEERDVEANWWT